MALLLGTSVLEHQSDANWSGTGTIFIRLNPNFTITDSAHHTFIGKTPFAFTLNFFSFSKNNTNQLQIGFYTGSEQRMSVAVGSLIATGTWANHVYTWNTGAPNQEYYVNNVLAISAATAFNVPTGNNRLSLGGIQTGTYDQLASSYFCHHARWNRVLTAGERQTLQVTGCPLFIPFGLVEYHPVTRWNDATRDLMGLAPLAGIGAPPTEISGPYFIRPESGRAQAQTPSIVLTVNPLTIAETATIPAPGVDLGAGPEVNPLSIYETATIPLPNITSDPFSVDPLAISETAAVGIPSIAFMVAKGLRITVSDRLAEG